MREGKKAQRREAMSLRRRTFGLATIVLAVCGASVSGVAHGVVLWSFEDGTDGWTANTVAGVTLSQTTVGATDGSHALLVGNIPGGFVNNIAIVPTFNSATAGFQETFLVFQQAAAMIAQGKHPKIQFDFTPDLSGVTNAETNPYLQIGVWVNSSTAGGGGFRQYGTGRFIVGNVGSTYPSLDVSSLEDGVTLTSLGGGTYRAVIPMGADLAATPEGTPRGLTLSNASTFFSFGFQSSSGVTGSLSYAFDNFRMLGVPTYKSDTLFSWETPDNPATPGVDERFEGWVTTVDVPSPPPGATLQPGHVHSITTTGASDGSYALQIDRRSLPSGFTWGSQFGLSETLTPGVQGQIDDLVAKINGAEFVAFDVTYEDQFPLNPSFTNFAVHFADSTGAFYQAAAPNFNINGALPGTRRTMQIPLSAFNEAPGGGTKNLAVDGLLVGTTELEIGISTSTDAGAVYQIDNFRLLTRIALDADFNGDLAVDGDDLAIWQSAYGTTGAGDADDDLLTNGSDFLVWQRQFGNSALSVAAASAVPEPSAWAIAAAGTAAILARRKRRRQ